jgi:pimeloyl-ACP methyl ester carboxylesterase
MQHDGLRLVLVHGGWGCPEMWRYVVAELGELAPCVRCADLPTTNRADAVLADDVAHVRELARHAQTVVLCGHSYGGFVITEAGHDLPGLRHLVYVAAGIPDIGETALDLAGRRPMNGPTPVVLDDGRIEPPPGVWGADNGSYDTETLARIRTLTLRPQADLRTPLSAVAWREVPSTAVIATNDRMLHPDTQREQAARAGSTAVEFDCGHMVNLAHPRDLARILTEVVAATHPAAVALPNARSR